jgi:hypothetical protein
LSSPTKIKIHGKPIREWEESTLDWMLLAFEELRKEGVIPSRDERIATELKAANRLN